MASQEALSMFKRHRNPLEKDLASQPTYGESATATRPAAPLRPTSRPTPHTEPTTGYRPAQQIPPRVFDPPKTETSTPYSKGVTPFSQADTPPAKLTTPEHPMMVAELQAEEPDTTLGEGVVFKGELTFKKLLRIDGQFEGDLVSDGKLSVGPTGVVKSNIRMKEAIIEGKVEGNITVTERLELRGNAEVIGDIKAKLISIDEGVSVIGHIAVTPDSTPAVSPLEHV